MVLIPGVRQMLDLLGTHCVIEGVSWGGVLRGLSTLVSVSCGGVQGGLVSLLEGSLASMASSMQRMCSPGMIARFSERGGTFFHFSPTPSPVDASGK